MSRIGTILSQEEVAFEAQLSNYLRIWWPLLLLLLSVTSRGLQALLMADHRGDVVVSVHYKMLQSIRMALLGPHEEKSAAVTADVAAAAAVQTTESGSSPTTMPPTVNIARLLMFTDWTEFPVSVRQYFERTRDCLIDQVTRFILLCTCLDDDYSISGTTRRAESVSFGLTMCDSATVGESTVEADKQYRGRKTSHERPSLKNLAMTSISVSDTSTLELQARLKEVRVTEYFYSSSNANVDVNSFSTGTSMAKGGAVETKGTDVTPKRAAINTSTGELIGRHRATLPPLWSKKH